MVFDEVDAGVGGRAAVQIGRRLARLARTHQVIVVTHLPQVAAYADVHLVVRAEDGAGARESQRGATPRATTTGSPSWPECWPASVSPTVAGRTPASCWKPPGSTADQWDLAAIGVIGPCDRCDAIKLMWLLLRRASTC